MSNLRSATINNTSDIGITCGQCGTVFSGQARYHDELAQLFAKHYRESHEQYVTIEPSMSAEGLPL